MLHYKSEGILLVISGPSGAGKGTVCGQLRDEIELHFSISATTRKPRDGEVNGVNYFFMDNDEFETQIQEDGFLEWAKVFDNYYGTPRAYVENLLKEGKDVLLEIDTQGALNIKQQMPNAVLVFIMPPSYTELEIRLRGRGTEAEDEIIKRLSKAVSEVEKLHFYDYVVVNNKIDDAVKDLRAIIESEKCHVIRNSTVIDDFINEKEKRVL